WSSDVCSSGLQNSNGSVRRRGQAAGCSPSATLTRFIAASKESKWQMDYLLGIDVGTGGTRAVLVDHTGSIASSATCEHEPFASPRTGWAEQNPHDWWKAAGSAIRAALAN